MSDITVPEVGVQVPLRGRLNGTRRAVVDYALVSEVDYERVMEMHWVRARLHACCSYKTKYMEKHANMFMHIYILGHTINGMIDHINRNGRDNRRSNLRIVSHTENIMNTALRSSNTSGFKGVSWSNDRQKWVAQIVIFGQSRTLGRFRTAIEAAKAYDVAAFASYGECAYLNFPKE